VSEEQRKVAAYYFKQGCDANDATACGHRRRLTQR